MMDEVRSQSSIAEITKKIQEDSKTWMRRIPKKDNDAHQVTMVTGKREMQPAGDSSTETPTKPHIKLKRERSNHKPRHDATITIPHTDGEESTNEKHSSKYENGTRDESGAASMITINNSETEYRTDEGFTEFYASSETHISESIVSTSSSTTSTTVKKKTTTTTNIALEVTVSDFDALTEGTRSTLGLFSAHRRSLRPARRTRPTTNPLRTAMRNRLSSVSEKDTEIKAQISIRKSKEEIEKNATRMAEAGLASKVDFAEASKILNTAKDVKEMGGSLAELLPYKDLMLIQVKGRRFVQVRLVEPRVASLNSGDCFILVTPSELFLWVGTLANIIEKSKATEITEHILKKRDLGCKAPSVIKIQEIVQDKSQSMLWDRFTELLGGKMEYRDVGAPDEDELHEICITETNMVYKVVGNSLEPCEEFWASPGKFKMLESNEILVFDFGSEIYVWRGKSTSEERRRVATKLAQLLWERGYDYSEYDVNPILPLDSKTRSANERPEWTLLGKATQNMETILFKHKFIDWPRQTDSKKKRHSLYELNEQIAELVPYDAKLMIQPSQEKPNLILEATNLGRGDEFYCSEMMKGHKVNTLSVDVWHHNNPVPEESFGQFHEGDTYVIRWRYNVQTTGMRSLKGEASRWEEAPGRDRCAYFFWQGRKSTINEKGATALMTVRLDKERGGQKQVVQGKEPAAFFQLFKGRMVVHVGRRDDKETNKKGSLRLYCVRGEHTKETSLLEVSAKMRSLRSRTSFILLNLEGVHNKKASMHLWHGAMVSKETRECAKHAAANLKEHLPRETGLITKCNLKFDEMEEGKETPALLKALGKDKKSYDSLLGDPSRYKPTPRLFHLSSGSGVFVSTEVLNPARSTDCPSPYPFLQSNLYSSEQPSLYMIDNEYEVCLWQGWWPEDMESHTGTTKTGSALIRWDIDRKLAMETVMAYCKEKRPKRPPVAFLVHAGLEPLTFTNLFPFWEPRDDLTNVQKKSGKKGDKAILVKDVLAKLTQARFTMEELSKRPLPEGVDPMKLETYLSDKEFESVLTMNREAFSKLSAWRQKELKKSKGLF